MGWLVSAKDVPLLLIYTIVTIGLTLLSCLTIGRVAARKSLALARFASGLCVPILGLAGVFFYPYSFPSWTAS
jgi:hypothetical protein